MTAPETAAIAKGNDSDVIARKERTRIFGLITRKETCRIRYGGEPYEITCKPIADDAEPVAEKGRQE